jgi:hypothetical protein
LTVLTLTGISKLYTGILDPDPWKRWTAYQAAHHPFLVGGPIQRKQDRPQSVEEHKDENQANLLCDIYWEAPFDPNICRRKLLNVQKMREKQQAARRGYNSRPHNVGHTRPPSTGSHDSERYVTHVDSVWHSFFPVECSPCISF